MAYPPKRKTSYEKVVIGEFIHGEIHDIEYDYDHKFTYKGEEKEGPAIRFIFKLEDYEFLHRSRWMAFNLGEKSNLYKKYVSKLVANAHKDMCFDLDALKGMKVKTIWEESNGFQSVESIYPDGTKITVEEIDPDTLPEEEKESEPF